MNAGFVSKKREELLWEVQRIIKQLKRKLRSFEKKHEKSMEDSTTNISNNTEGTNEQISTNATKQINLQPGKPTNQQTKLSCSDDESIKTSVTAQSTGSAVTTCSKNTPQQEVNNEQIINNNNNNNNLECQQFHPEGLYIDESTGFLMLPKSHTDYATLIRLQLENRELLAWKTQLQTRISAERAEILSLKLLHQQKQAAAAMNEQKSTNNIDNNSSFDGDFGKVIENYLRENALLEHKKSMLAKQIFDERRELVALQVELNMQQF